MLKRNFVQKRRETGGGGKDCGFLFAEFRKCRGVLCRIQKI